ncbi:MAG: translocation/assembly module TamB domain-containing protein [Gammaproteobacteria bacterium]|nr:translocation/assembly module TamB domain-containing protein [Gammaproteobacteria bacterium]
MKKLRLIIPAVLLLPLTLLGWLTATENGLNWAWRQAQFYLPFEITIDKLEGRLIGPLTIKGFEYQQDALSINAEQITFDWLATALLAANINISQLHIQSLNIILSETAEKERNQGLAPKQAIQLPDISLPWRLLLKNAEIDGLSLSQNGRFFRLNKVKLDATTLFSTVNIQQLSIDGDTFNIAIKGKLKPTRDYSHDLDISWQFTLPGSDVIHGKGKMSGSMQKTRLLQTLSGPLNLTLDMQANKLLEQLSWTARADIRQFALPRLAAGWPALSGAAKLNASGDLQTATLMGTMQGRYPELGKLDADFELQRLADNRIQINRLQLQAPEHDTRLNADGSWMPNSDNGGDVKLALNWQNLRWPAKGTPWFDSARGNGTIAGNINAYQLTLDTDSPWPQTAPSTWQAYASGNLDGMKIQNLHINALHGEANISGKLNWSRQFNWQAQGSISSVDPAALWPQWPGRLEGKLTSSGRVENSEIIADADINQLTGQLRGYPVSLRSRLAWQKDQLAISQLNYRAGESRLQLDGRLGKTLDLNWNISSQDLAELYPQARGELQAKGSLKGSAEAPLVEAAFNGKTLSYPDIEIGAIDGEMAVELFHWRKIDLRLAVQALNIYNTRLLSADIKSADNNINAQLVSSRVTAQIKLHGQADTAGWHGSIDKADVLSEYFDSWQLDKPVPLAISEKSLSLDKLCWHSNQQASICASLGRQKTGWLSSIRMNDVPLKLFEVWLPAELKLEGTADATADIEYQYPEMLLVKLDIILPAGSVSYPMLSGENDQRQYSAGKFQLTLNTDGLKASSAMTMANGDEAYAQLTLPGFNPFAIFDPAQPLKASARLSAKNLRMIESFVPEIYDMQGELKLQLSASGTVEQPLVSGNAKIVNGTMQIPGLGVDIRQITFSGHSFASQKFDFRLDAHSGDGKLVITGQTLLDRNAGWPTEISITGKDFEAAHIPEAMITISPELQLKLQHHTIDIKGKVHIPYAKLQPRDVTTAASVSADTVIIGEGQVAKEKWLITTSVRLTLGERVHFYGFGFEGRLGGSLLLEDEPGQLTKATGEITIPEGIYRAYGQRLEIENGRILYTGGPLTNPGLDVRAVRKVDTVTAGIYVKGSLSQPQLEIFSSPTMSQTDALAYILLGGPIENASNEDGQMMAKAALALGLSGGDTIARSLADRFGLDDMRIESSNKGDQAALVVGRYLSPKIYVSYGVGLIERVDTLTLRYQITNKWQLKVESGAYQGADMLYTIER